MSQLKILRKKVKKNGEREGGKDGFMCKLQSHCCNKIFYKISFLIAKIAMLFLKLMKLALTIITAALNV